MTSWDNEEWRDVCGYEGRYEVSNLGRVRSLARLVNRQNWTSFQLPGRILRPRSTRKGYLIVALCRESKQKNFTVHRLVAKAFIPNPSDLPEVNHRNGDKTDNRVENLEWVTAAENVKHSITALGHKRDKPKYSVICLDTGRIYRSAREAAQATGCRYSGITAVCRGEKITHHGLRWTYREVLA